MSGHSKLANYKSIKKYMLEWFGIAEEEKEDKPIHLSVQDAKRIYTLASSYFREKRAIIIDDISDKALYALEQELDKVKE